MGKCFFESQCTQSALAPRTTRASEETSAAVRARVGRRARKASASGAKRRSANSDNEPATSTSTRSKLTSQRCTAATSSGRKSCVMSERRLAASLFRPTQPAWLSEGKQPASQRSPAAIVGWCVCGFRAEVPLPRSRTRLPSAVGGALKVPRKRRSCSACAVAVRTSASVLMKAGA